MWMPSRSISRQTDRRTDGVTDSPKTPVEAHSSLCSKTIVDTVKVTGAKGDLCPGSFMSTGANAPVAPVESAPMHKGLTERESSVQETFMSDLVVVNRLLFAKNI